MEKLLQWSIAQQSGDETTRDRIPAPDPETLAQVLGASTKKDDATLMKEDISVLLCDDSSITVDDRLTALDDFEMLIQNLDNANNMGSMGIWNEIVKLYDYEGEEQDEFRGMAAYITGTAVQNNTKAQEDFLKHTGEKGLKHLIGLLNESDSIKARALYALSSLVAHNGTIYSLFKKFDGWNLIIGLLKEDLNPSRYSNKVLLRSLNLLKSLLYEEIVAEGSEPINKKVVKLEVLKNYDVVANIIGKLNQESHVDINDRIISLLNFLRVSGYEFSNEETILLEKHVQGLSSIEDKLNAEDFKVLKESL